MEGLKCVFMSASNYQLSRVSLWEAQFEKLQVIYMTKCSLQASAVMTMPFAQLRNGLITTAN